MDTGDILLVGGIGVALVWLYNNGYFGSSTVASTTTATAVAPASVSLAGPVQSNQGNNSFSAQVSINGTVQPVTIGVDNGIAEDQYGDNITATLQAEGVNVPALLQMMEAAYSPSSGTSGLGFASRISRGLIHGRAF